MKTGAATPPDVVVDLDTAGIMWIEIGREAASVSLGLEELRAIDRSLDDVEQQVAEGSATGLILVSGTKNRGLDDWGAGEILGSSEEMIAAWSREAQSILDRIECLPLHTLAALEGRWIGAAAELALAFDYRVAANSPEAGIGFPATLRARVPAWGATVRLPRGVGLDRSLRLLLGGEILDAREARAIGLIDRVLADTDFTGRAARFLARRIARGERWNAPRRRIFGGTASGSRLPLKRATKRYLAPAHAGRPTSMAARVTFELLARAHSSTPEGALALESAAAARVMASTETSARLYAEHCLESVSVRSLEAESRTEGTMHVAVLGSHRTASDLAALLVASGADVRVKDHSRTAAGRGVAAAARRIEWDLATGRISPAEASARRTRLLPVTGYGGFGTLDLVVAVQERAEDLRPLLAECEAHVGPKCILALHEWVPPPGAERLDLRASRRIVIVQSWPADRFPLLELLDAPGTDEPAVGTVRTLARRLGVSLVPVEGPGPSPGIRLLAAYLSEASRLLDEGATVEQVDGAAEDYGFAVGPFKRMDALGADRTYGLIVDSDSALGRDPPACRWLGRFARDGRTFYSYRKGIPAGSSEDLPSGLSPDADVVSALVGRRLLLILLVEAIRIVEEGLLAEPILLDAVALNGLGFPPARGGLLYAADRMGAARLLEELTAARDRFGTRFAPPDSLREIATRGGTFTRTGSERAATDGPAVLDNFAADR